MVYTRDPASIPVTETSQVGEARRVGVAMAEALGFDETARGQIAIVLTEMATNLVRHATGGEIILRSLPPVNCCGLEVMALDRGPGIASISDALRDGFSTGNSSGTGLGAVGRLSTSFDVFSHPKQGTAVLAQFSVKGPAVLDSAYERVGWVCLPMKGEPACGDACDIVDLPGGRTVVIVADGLGHGLQAAEASRRAITLFRENHTLDGPALMDVLHAGLRSTRGAAVSIADIRRDRSEIRFTGVGNVSARLVHNDAGRGMVCQNGTVGAEMRRVQEFTYPWTRDTLLVMHSDGLTSQWNLTKYPGLLRKHAALISGVLYRDFRRERDDITVLALGDRGRA